MPNRLSGESSPYLLQHKDNPVDWYPWSEEALSRARQEDKPIFLSIGYSACHWCHVMEHESFESEKIAQMLNENFVSIKVDREERPDLDQIYMNAVMALQRGQGGWPLNVFLTPQQEVFFGGTYWPPMSRMGMPGFDQVLHGVLDAYLNRRHEVDDQSRQITAWLNRNTMESTDLELDHAVLDAAIKALHQSFDFDHGGFGSAPKFPHATDLMFLVQMARTDQAGLPFDSQVLLDMVGLTLRKMAYGGLFDHLGGGFARYSVDAVWLVPHFEKMLYDNALLVPVYLEMYRETGDEFYSMIAAKTLNYLLRDMRDESGGFHSTEDADSEGEEGKFYVWSRDEVMEVLGKESGARFCSLYNVTEAGNFEGHNILNMRQSFQQFADAQDIDKEALRDEMREARSKLLAVRSKRIRPGKDDKILASWNALAISAFAQAAVLLDSEEYLKAAQDAASFVLSEMRDSRDRLFHTWRHGKAKIDGFLDDYAGMIVALLDLYSVDFDSKWLQAANETALQMIEHFADDQGGGFFFSADDSEQLIARTKSFQDSSVPSGNSLAALGLLGLGRLTGSTQLVEWAHSTIAASASLTSRAPLAAGQMLITLQEQLKESIQLVVVSSQVEDARRIGKKVIRSGKSGISVAFIDASQPPSQILEPIATGKQMVEDQPTLYVCRGSACDQPVAGAQQMEQAVDTILNSDSSATVN